MPCLLHDALTYPLSMQEDKERNIPNAPTSGPKTTGKLKKIPVH